MHSQKRCGRILELSFENIKNFRAKKCSIGKSSSFPKFRSSYVKGALHNYIRIFVLSYIRIYANMYIAIFKYTQIAT